MRKIAPYYQKLTEKAKEYSRRRHPVSFIGMFDCGRNYLFSLLTGQKTGETEPKFLFIELTKTEGEEKKIVAAFQKGFSLNKIDGRKFSSLNEIFLEIKNLCQKLPITIVFNFGYRERINLSLIENLYSWGNILGEKLNWIIFANYGFLNLSCATTIAFEKVVKTHIIPVLPLDFANSLVVFNNCREYLGEVEKRAKEKIIELSGGNPGLLKSLFILAQKRAISQWKDEDQLLMRIEKIFQDLSQKELFALKKGERLENLVRFGYLKSDGKIFSPIVAEYLPTYFQETGLSLSTTQQKVFLFLKEKFPDVASRDEIAKTMWGFNNLNKYSDWAIDQMIYSLRLSLRKIKSPWQIKTKRNFGYFLKKEGRYGGTS